MNQNSKLILGAAAFFLAIFFSFAATAQDASQAKWTVIGDADAPISTVSNDQTSAGAVESLAHSEAEEETDWTVVDAKKIAVDKAMKGIRSPGLFKSQEITQETIELMFAPYHTQNKAEFLSHSEHNLADVIARAKAIHTQAKAAQEGISLAQRRLLLAIRQMFPELTFEYNHRDGSLSASEYLSRGQRFSMRQPLFRGGVLWNSFLQERQMLEASRKNYQKVMDELVLEISKVYFEYQRARAVKEDQKKVMETVKPQIEFSEKKFKEKITSEIEHLNAQSLAGQIEFDHETSKQDFEIAQLDLQHYLGLDMNDDVDLKEEYSAEKIIATMSQEDELDKAKIESSLGSFNHGQPIPELTELVEMSYGHRAELAVQVSLLQAARYDERAKWGGMVPKADLVVEWGTLGEAFKEFTNNADHKSEFRVMLEVDWNAVGNKLNYTYENDRRAPSVTQFQSGTGTITARQSFSVGLLNGLDAFVDIKQAEVTKLNNVVELETAEKKVLEDVKKAYYEYQKALIQMKSVMKRVAWRQRLRDLAQHRLESREVEISEYLQAEIDLLKERGDFHSALKDYYSAKSSLNYAVGVQEFLSLEKND